MTDGQKVLIFLLVSSLAVPSFMWWYIPKLQEWSNYKKNCVLVAQMPTDEYTGNSARGTRKRLYVNVYECADGRVKRLIESGPVSY